MNNKIPTHKLYPVAEGLFVEQGLTAARISEILTISENTLSRWRSTMGWDAKREGNKVTPNKIRELLLSEMEAVARGEKPKINADALSKINKALTYIDGKVSLEVIIAVLIELDNWMAAIDPPMAAKMTEFHKLFIAQRAENDSKKA